MLRASSVTSHLILMVQTLTSNSPLSLTKNIRVFNIVDIMNPISDHISFFALVSRKLSVHLTLRDYIGCYVVGLYFLFLC